MILCRTLSVLFDVLFVFFLFVLLPLGIRIGLFTPDKAFDLVCKDQIKKMREPSIKLVDLATHEMIVTLKQILVKVIFPEKNPRNARTLSSSSISATILVQPTG